MEQRFKFKSPSPSELTLAERGKLLLPLVAVAVIALNMIHWPSAFFKIGFGLLVSVTGIWLILRISDIQRRYAQATFGFVELTSWEIRVSLSERSLLRIEWPNFTGFEIKNGWLQLKYSDAQFEQGGQTKRLDRVRLNELENSDALVAELNTRTPAPK